MHRANEICCFISETIMLMHSCIYRTFIFEFTDKSQKNRFDASHIYLYKRISRDNERI